MARRSVKIGILVLLAAAALAWTNCPPASLTPNPAPVVVGSAPKCLAEASNASLDLNENWSATVKLSADKSYFFAASKCARAYMMAAEIKDQNGKILKSDSGSKISMCFKPPDTDLYTVNYRVTELNGSYSFAITDACLSESKCKP